MNSVRRGVSQSGFSSDSLNTLASLHNWDAGIGPVLTVTPRDHFGGAGVWLIKFTGRNNQPFFEDLTEKFLTMQDLNITLSLAMTIRQDPNHFQSLPRVRRGPPLGFHIATK